MDALFDDIRACRLCAARFAATRTAHVPRPVVRIDPGATILIAGQAPGARVQASGLPFDDPSGDRLRDWLELDRAAFYGPKLAFLPTAFCFPGYDAKGSDLPPPPVCAKTWHARVLDGLPHIRLRLLIGGHAQAFHLGRKAPMTETVRRWREMPADLLPLPHPSWRNTAWLKRNPWFAEELLPELRHRVREALQ